MSDEQMSQFPALVFLICFLRGWVLHYTVELLLRLYPLFSQQQRDKVLTFQIFVFQETSLTYQAVQLVFYQSRQFFIFKFFLYKMTFIYIIQYCTSVPGQIKIDDVNPQKMSIFPRNVMYLPFLDNKCAPPGPLRRIFLCCIKEILQSLLLDNKISLQELASIQYTASFDARKTYRTRECPLQQYIQYVCCGNKIISSEPLSTLSLYFGDIKADGTPMPEVQHSLVYCQLIV